MSFWDSVRKFFGGGESSLEGQVRAAMVARAQRRESFTALDIANDLTGTNPARTVDDIRAVTLLVDPVFQKQVLAPFGYQVTPGGQYHPPEGVGAPGAVPPRVGATQPPVNVVSQLGTLRQQQGSAPASRPSAPPPKTENPFETNEEILGLSKEEMRKRALKINPHRTAWIGRVDTIPPQSDERTALIDRGLELRGFLTKKQLDEIHTVGDLWLKHHEAAKLADTIAAKSADAVIEARKKAHQAAVLEKKQQAAEKKARRAEEIARRKKEDIIYLGPGVSKGLADRHSNLEKLQGAGLPVLSTPADVAKALGLSVPKLRWLCFHSEAAEKPHYFTFEIEKRSGGKRLLAAPHATLSQAQHWVLANVLEKLSTEAPAHGFIKGKSVVTNARPHVGQDLVINLDVKDFFPSVTFRRVRGVFQRLGYSPAVATVLALLCTESPRRKVEYDGKPLWVAVGPRALPQGACTSPALSNQVTKKLDRRLAGRLTRQGWTYTRYADDLTFSARPGKRDAIGRLHAVVRHTLDDEGFTLHPKKGRFLPRTSRQMVTGVVVNTKLSVRRDEVRRLRAILHQAKKTGLAAQNRENRPDFELWLRGKIAWVQMVDPAKGAKLLAALEVLGR